MCTPGGDDGNYIMFARATSGDKKNNHQFSPCSLKAINGVLAAKARGPKGCFTGMILSHSRLTIMNCLIHGDDTNTDRTDGIRVWERSGGRRGGMRLRMGRGLPGRVLLPHAVCWLRLRGSKRTTVHAQALPSLQSQPRSLLYPRLSAEARGGVSG